MDLYLVFLAKPLPQKPRRLHLRGYASRYSRIDVLARIVLAVKHLSPQDGGAELLAWVPVEGEEGRTLELRPRECAASERGVVLSILRAVYGEGDKCALPQSLTPERLFHSLARTHKLALLHERGEDFARICGNPVPIAWILGGHLDPPNWAIELALRYGAEPVSIGPFSYLASHVVSYTLISRMVCRKSWGAGMGGTTG